MAKKLQQGELNDSNAYHKKGSTMIEVTRINNKKIIVNADLIEFIESTPDTIITTTSGKKIIVQDTVKDVIVKVINYRRNCFPFKRIKPVSEDVIEDLTNYYQTFSGREGL